MNEVGELTSATVEATRPVQRRSARYISWDVLRVLGIAAVIAFHSTLLAPLSLPGLDMPPAKLQMDFPFGAAVLIVISGYFAAMTIRKHSPLRWWLRRLARLLPAFLVAVLAIFASIQLFAPPDFPHPDYGDLIGNLTLMHLILPGVEYVDLAHWTVPVQVAGFTAIALLAWSGKVRGRVATAVMWAVLLIPLAVRVTFMGPGQIVPQWLSIVMDGTGLNRSHLLLAGFAIFRWSKGRMSFANLFAMLVVVVMALHYHPPQNDSLPAFMIALALICIAAYQPDWDVPLLNGWLARPIQWLAGISYGVYLMHFVMGTIVARRLADLGMPWFVWVPAFAVTAVVLGWALTKFVERPMFRLLTRPLDTRPVPNPPMSAQSTRTS